MKDRNLTGPWAGFSFEAGFLVTPEGRRFDPVDLRWLSLTCNLAQEWRLMMDEAAQEAAESRSAVVTTLRSRLAHRRRLSCARRVQRG
ncbi:DUF3653 domain-containing protein [Pseudoxanthomonas sp.]|uniref:DUF3653 domain-containing protein n=1 Tax=Pseudoxanthomonas sp. TaxID=1871049 RepID=UPI00260BF35D|nr:DUF3653 domain-containing protein [Pseudoxanthomonas sp.]WDS36965.1 MAG: DUF3653 domain-containing protein [Pseudoxanthomonas sp.]